MKPYELLEQSIIFATAELDEYKVSKDLSDTYNMVISSLYRKIIELSDGVRVCALFWVAIFASRNKTVFIFAGWNCANLLWWYSQLYFFKRIS